MARQPRMLSVDGGGIGTPRVFSFCHCCGKAMVHGTSGLLVRCDSAKGECRDPDLSVFNDAASFTNATGIL